LLAKEVKWLTKIPTKTKTGFCLFQLNKWFLRIIFVFSLRNLLWFLRILDKKYNILSFLANFLNILLKALFWTPLLLLSSKDAITLLYKTKNKLVSSITWSPFNLMHKLRMLKLNNFWNIVIFSETNLTIDSFPIVLNVLTKFKNNCSSDRVLQEARIVSRSSFNLLNA